MNIRQIKIRRLRAFFINHLVEDPQNGTDFDCKVSDTLQELQNSFADKSTEGYIITDEMQKLGFVLKNGSGIAGCSTIPCFGGKMPYQNEPLIPCAIGQIICNESPIQILREQQTQKLRLMREQL